MTIKQILIKYSISEIELLLGDALKQSKEFLYSHPEQQLTGAQTKRFQKHIAAFKKGLPIAYLLGYKDFYGLRFKVTRSTLIPRPESEWLIDRSLELLKSVNNPKVIDIGTGSGCLAISLKVHSPKTEVTAIDVSSQALLVAKFNAKVHKTKIKFRKQSLLQRDKSKYDLIIANLPYVPKKVYNKLLPNLKFEPKSALVDPKRDFNLYEQLLIELPSHLNPNGVVLLEIDPSMKTLLEKWSKKNMPRANLTFSRDLHDLWRFCEIKF